MVVLKIFNVHEKDEEKPLSTFEVGEHVVGRGSFTNCMDKRISRRHIIINVKENEATLTLVHVSPILFMSKDSPHIQMIKKDNTVQLSDGDKFAFLMETWYTFKIEEDQVNNDNIAGSESSVVPASNPVSSNTVIVSKSNTMISQSTSYKRRSDESYSEERKKLRLFNESLDKLEDNINKIASLDFPTNSEDNRGSPSEVENNNTTEVFRGIDISDSDEDSDVEGLPEVTCDTEVVHGVQDKSEENSDTHNTVDNDKQSDILDNVKEEPKIEDDEKPSIKTEAQEEASIADNDTTGNSNENLSGPVKNEGETAVETPVGNEIAISDHPDSADATASSSRTSNRVRREKCWYGQSCYRKNPGHKNDFSHPGDSDHEEDSDDDRPLCPYGAQCYRKNPQHRKDYKHPSSRPAPGPSTSNRKKRKRNANTQGDMDYDSDSMDEGDPFSADESSSASEVFDGGDSDSDYLEDPDPDDLEDSEEVKTMFKEAKKFLRKKR